MVCIVVLCVVRAARSPPRKACGVWFCPLASSVTAHTLCHFHPHPTRAAMCIKGWPTCHTRSHARRMHTERYLGHHKGSRTHTKGLVMNFSQRKPWARGGGPSGEALSTSRAPSRLLTSSYCSPAVGHPCVCPPMRLSFKPAPHDARHPRAVSAHSCACNSSLSSLCLPPLCPLLWGCPALSPPLRVCLKHLVCAVNSQRGFTRR